MDLPGWPRDRRVTVGECRKPASVKVLCNSLSSLWDSLPCTSETASPVYFSFIIHSFILNCQYSITAVKNYHKFSSLKHRLSSVGWNSSTSLTQLKSRHFPGPALALTAGERICFQAPAGGWQTSVPWCCRTEVPSSFLAVRWTALLFLLRPSLSQSQQPQRFFLCHIFPAFSLARSLSGSSVFFLLRAHNPG